MIDKMHKTTDVFCVNRDVPLNYVERKSIDDKFISKLSSNATRVEYLRRYLNI